MRAESVLSIRGSAVPEQRCGQALPQAARCLCTSDGVRLGLFRRLLGSDAGSCFDAILFQSLGVIVDTAARVFHDSLGELNQIRLVQYSG